MTSELDSDDERVDAAIAEEHLALRSEMARVKRELTEARAQLPCGHPAQCSVEGACAVCSMVKIMERMEASYEAKIQSMREALAAVMPFVGADPEFSAGEYDRYNAALNLAKAALAAALPQDKSLAEKVNRGLPQGGE